MIYLILMYYIPIIINHKFKFFIYFKMYRNSHSETHSSILGKIIQLTQLTFDSKPYRHK